MGERDMTSVYSEAPGLDPGTAKGHWWGNC